MAFPAVLATILGPLIGGVLEKIIPDKNARAEAQEEITKTIASLDEKVLEGQFRLNEMNAASTSLFVAGARPFILWGSGIGMLYMLLVWPHLTWLAAIYGWPAPPALDGDLLYALVTSILGLAGIRGWEKVKGVARNK